MQDLWEKGYTVIDCAFTGPTCQAFREEIEALRAEGLLHLNSTHLVKGNSRKLLQKHGIYEAEVADKVMLRILHPLNTSACSSSRMTGETPVYVHPPWSSTVDPA
jgi:hypothetical protein